MGDRVKEQITLTILTGDEINTGFTITIDGVKYRLAHIQQVRLNANNQLIVKGLWNTKKKQST